MKWPMQYFLAWAVGITAYSATRVASPFSAEDASMVARLIAPNDGSGWQCRCTDLGMETCMSRSISRLEHGEHGRGRYHSPPTNLRQPPILS